jgi:capsular polysaccharide biosynthesis protein
MKIVITESKNKIIDQFITFLIKPYTTKKTRQYRNALFWVKGDQVIAQMQPSTNDFRLIDEIWSRISQMFDLDDDQTRTAIVKWLKKHYYIVGMDVDMVPSLRHVKFDD